MREVARMRDGDIEIRVTMPYSTEQIEDFVAEMIASTRVGAVTVEDVIANLRVMRVKEPEQYEDMIIRMIDADTGGSNA